MRREPAQNRLRRILRAYRLEPLTVMICPHNFANEVFFVSARTGRYVVKNCTSGRRSIASLEVELALGAHLRENGVLCPEAVETHDGRWIYEDESGEVAVVTRFVEGETTHPQDVLEDYHRAGTIKCLAMFHRAASSFSPRYDTDIAKALDMDGMLAWIEGLARTLRDASRRGPAVERMSALVTPLRELVEQVSGMFPPHARRACPTQIIHGDLHQHNCIFRDEDFYCCCDFDFIRRDLRLFDLQSTRVHLGMAIESGPGLPVSLVREDLARTVGQYRRFNGLPDEELAWLPAMGPLFVLWQARFLDPALTEQDCIAQCDLLELMMHRCLDGLDRERRALDSVLESWDLVLQETRVPQVH